MLLRVERNPDGRRVHFLRWRIHHYHTGFALILAGIKLIWTDRKDLRHRS